MGESDSLANETTDVQHIALWLGRALALISWVCIYMWASGEKESQGFNGGMSNWGNTEEIFAWHPVMMTMGMVFVGGFAITAFRLPYLTKEQNKMIHSICHAAAIICWSFGLAAIWRNKYRNKNDDGTYKQSMKSFHSMIGLISCVLYAFNYFIGLLVYGVGVVDVETKKHVMPWHVFLGTFVFLSSFAAVLSGLQNESTTCNVEGSTDEPNTNPASNWSDQNEGCHYLQSATLCAYFAVALLFFGIQRSFHRMNNPSKDRLMDI